TKQNEEYTIVDLQADWNVFFGEIALMDNDERSASIRVLEDCGVLVMDRDKFNDLGKSHPALCLHVTQVIVKIICGRLRGVNDDVILLFDALVNEVQSTQL
ncbi:MAG: cyclic nucleotide-binding domain-containing protein, partial [Proteobacteria bacterium]|nr:cyclic nucleotide-binding domain-containing protein [Pseudomonadota bacterium]